MPFQIAQILAGGQFGTVCVVRESHTGRLMAAKVLRREHLDNAKIVARIRDEARLLSRLEHPNIVRVHELRTIAGRPVLLLEWVRGVALHELVRRHAPRGVPLAESLEMIRLAAGALHAAFHTPTPDGGILGVVHRDIKPANLLLSQAGALKVVDFGIAHGQFDGKESQTVSMVLGARGFLAPERLDGAEDSPRGDVYALGHTLHELATCSRLQLSLHPAQHARALERAGRALSAGESQGARADTARLISSMSAYSPDERPEPAAVQEAIGRILARHGLRPDLHRYASNVVRPMVEARVAEAPVQHPDYGDVRFLEVPSGKTPGPAAPRIVDRQIRAFLRSSDWCERIDELRELMAMDPSWTAAPLLDHLQIAVPPWWRFWAAGLSPKQISTLLALLEQRPSPAVRSTAERFAAHGDPDVRAVAARLLTARTRPGA